ncbi:MAG: amidohydrolase family protein [Actinomycetota bacterium]|nr:amidohydrolase family protein [Actinomycetota bacterium]
MKTSHSAEFRRLKLFAILLCISLVGACGGQTPEETNVARTSEPSTVREGEEEKTRQSTRKSRDQPEEIEADLVVTGGTLVDGTDARPLEDAAVAVEGNRIVAVGKSDSLRVADGARVVAVNGGSILPGLVNTHVHSRYVTLEETRAWTRDGVTTVLDLGGSSEELLGRKRATVESGDAELPRLFVSGPMITVPGGHPIPIYGPDYPALAVRGPDDAKSQIERLISEGVDRIKIAVSGRMDTGWPELSDEEIQAITQAAHDGGIRVSVHVDTASGLRRAVENGVDDAAHAPRDTIPNNSIREMVERGVTLTPTIDVYQNIAEDNDEAADWNATTLPVMYDNLRRFVEAGGTLALGDDFGNPGVELGMPMDEIEHWKAAGLTPMQTIIAATRGGATVGGLLDDIGTLQTSKTANILVVNGNPLVDIQALENIELVVHNGKIVSSS